jgi:hypothetical protein
MKNVIAALIFISVISAPAMSHADTMANANNNTIVVTYPNGAVARYHFNADNTFGLHAPDGSHVHGTYEVAGDQLCLTPNGGERACVAYVADKSVGDSWTQTAADGATINVTMQAGREHAH